MASKYWIKLYHEVLDDPKMGRLNDHLWRRAIEFMLVAGEYDQAGMLPELGDMAWKLRVSEEQLQTDLESLSVTNIVTFRDSRWHVTKFAERQAPVEDAERKRQQRKREMTPPPYMPPPPPKEPLMPTDGDGNSHDGVTIGDIDTDTDTDIKDSSDDDTQQPNQDTSKKKTQSSIKLEYLERVFADARGCDPPDWTRARDAPGLQKTWRTPLRQILKQCQDDEERAGGVVRRTVAQMKKDRLTFSMPIQILATAESMMIDEKSGGNANGYTAA